MLPNCDKSAAQKPHFGQAGSALAAAENLDVEVTNLLA
jgi:hypothetical protein